MSVDRSLEASCTAYLATPTSWTTFEWHAFLSAPRAGTTPPGEARSFPADVRIKDQLSYYADQFDTTELNGVFYRTPTPEAVTAWREQTGRDFVFAWKASKFITHWKRLSDRSENSLELLEDRMSLLRGKAGPILFQLPPQFEAGRRAARLVLQALVQETPLQLRISPPELVSTAHSQNAVRREHLTLPVRPSRCAGALETHGGLRLCPWTWPERTLSRPLFAGGARPMGRAPEVLEAARLRRLCLFRQRPERARRRPTRRL